MQVNRLICWSVNIHLFHKLSSQKKYQQNFLQFNIYKTKLPKVIKAKKNYNYLNGTTNIKVFIILKSVIFISCIMTQCLVVQVHEINV